jgi:hypothetical protein
MASAEKHATLDFSYEFFKKMILMHKPIHTKSDAFSHFSRNIDMLSNDLDEKNGLGKKGPLYNVC